MTADGTAGNSNAEQYLHWLNPTQREDYRAVEIDGKTQAEHAADRGVKPATVSRNISRAKTRLQEIAAERLDKSDRNQNGATPELINDDE